VVEGGGVVPLRAGCDLERAHLVDRVDGRDVEGQRGEPALAAGLLRHGEVTVPGLVLSPGERDVEADLHDLVVGAEHRRADAAHPGVVHEVEEPADLLRVDLDVPAFRSASHRTALAAARLLERGLHVLTQVGDPFAAECALAGGDAVGVKRLDLGLEP
jgi:hypothetical protein